MGSNSGFARTKWHRIKGKTQNISTTTRCNQKSRVYFQTCRIAHYVQRCIHNLACLRPCWRLDLDPARCNGDLRRWRRGRGKSRTACASPASVRGKPETVPSLSIRRDITMALAAICERQEKYRCIAAAMKRRPSKRSRNARGWGESASRSAEKHFSARCNPNACASRSLTTSHARRPKLICIISACRLQRDARYCDYDCPGSVAPERPGRAISPWLMRERWNRDWTSRRVRYDIRQLSAAFPRFASDPLLWIAGSRRSFRRFVNFLRCDSSRTIFARAVCINTWNFPVIARWSTDSQFLRTSYISRRERQTYRGATKRTTIVKRPTYPKSVPRYFAIEHLWTPCETPIIRHWTLGRGPVRSA